MATTQTAPPQKTASQLATRLQNDAHDVALAAEEILFQTDPPYDFSSADATVLRMAGFTDEEKLNVEVRRINTAKRHLAAAGSNAEFSAAEKNLVTTRALEKRLGPELEQQIRQAQQKLNDVKLARQRAEAAVSTMQNAREALRADTVIPVFCMDEVNANYRLQLPALKERVNKLESRLTLIDAVLNLLPSSQGAKLYAEKVDREQADNEFHQPLIEKRVENQVIISTLNPTRFATHMQQLKVERPDVMAELEAAQGELAARRKECEGAREFYLRKLP